MRSKSESLSSLTSPALGPSPTAALPSFGDNSLMNDLMGGQEPSPFGEEWDEVQLMDSGAGGANKGGSGGLPTKTGRG